jgi:hypothetical protein
VSTLNRYRREATRARLRTRTGQALIAGPALLGLVVGALVTRSASGAFWMLLLGLFAGFAVIANRAAAEAVRRALGAWGEPRGLAVVSQAAKPRRMKWIDATRGKMGPGLTGPLAGAVGGLGHYTYTTGSGKDREEHPYTLAWTQVGVADATAVSLGPREMGGLFDGIMGAFSSWHELELESVEFERRFSLWVADRSDATAVRRFFTPAVIVRCLEQPPAGRLEIGAGVLCLSVERHLVEPDDLDGVAAELARWATMLRMRRASVAADAAPGDLDGAHA